MSNKLADIYDDVESAVPYVNREQMEAMLNNETVFSVVAINERVGSYMNKPREEWVVTLELASDGTKVLCTFVKTANRDKFMQAIAAKLPVTECKFARRGKSKSWVFVPKDYVNDEEGEDEAPAPATKSRRGGK